MSVGRTCPASKSSLIGLLHGDLSRSAAGRALTVPPSTSTSIMVTAKYGEICRTCCGSSTLILHKEQIRFFPSVTPSLNAVVLVPITLFHRKEAHCRSLLRLFYHCFIIIVPYCYHSFITPKQKVRRKFNQGGQARGCEAVHVQEEKEECHQYTI